MWISVILQCLAVIGIVLIPVRKSGEPYSIDMRGPGDTPVMQLQSKEKTDVQYGYSENLELPAGDYIMTVKYSCSSYRNLVSILSDTLDSENVEKVRWDYLDPQTDTTRIGFSLAHTVSDLQVAVDCADTEGVTLESIHVRKLTSIDGKIAFCGGLNLSDEYVNEKERFGYWKDSAVMVEGEAAWSITCFFLQLWQINKPSSEDFSQFDPWKDEACPIRNDGFVQPYTDIPLDHERVSESVYMHMINSAEKYLYLSTPYLILDEDMISALCLAAKSGVDVRIVTPSKYDKWMIHQATRCYYRDLVKAGVRIYEYTPGFMHSKTVVADDKCAIVGSVNWDYRSLYLHFESAVWMCGTDTVLDVRDDLLKSFEQSDEVLREELNFRRGWSLFRLILRLIAPIF